MTQPKTQAPADEQQLTRYEPVVVIDESRDRLTASGAAMEAKEGGRWVRYADVAAALASQRAPQAAPIVPEGWRDLARRCLAAMQQAVHFRTTGQGRPPEQTCLIEIQELESLLATPLQIQPTHVVECLTKCTDDLVGAKRLLIDLHAAVPEARELIERRTGSWFAWGVDRDAQSPQAQPALKSFGQYVAANREGIDAAHKMLDAEQPAPVAPCAQCSGTGIVADGQITGEGGAEFEMGPITCVKDCPSCSKTVRLPAPVAVDERKLFEAEAVRLGWPPTAPAAYWQSAEQDYSSGSLSSGWAFWQARAALQSAPVPVPVPVPVDDGVILKALISAESILRYAPDFTTNCNGTRPIASTSSALEGVRSAIAAMQSARCGQDGGDAGGEPFGQVVIYRAEHPNHVDRHEFYPWPHPPYLDNASECHTVYTTPRPAAVSAEGVDDRAQRDKCKQAWLKEPDDCTALEAYDRGWKDGYKHGAWAAAPAATVQGAGQAVGEQVVRAAHAAVAAIYLADNSDYKPALWDVVRHLAPDLAGLLESNELKAHKASAARVAALAANKEQSNAA